MSILIAYGNKNKATIIADTRATCNMSDGSIKYYDNIQKVYKYGNSIIGIIGNGKFTIDIMKIYKNSFENKQQLYSASYETVFNKMMKLSKEQHDNYKEIFSIIFICGISSTNEIKMCYFDTVDYLPKEATPKTEEYVSKIFCNEYEPEMNQQIHNIVNNTEEKYIINELHYFIKEKSIIKNDDTISCCISVETICL